MKIINEKGKLFGLVNIVDLTVIMIILLCAAGLGYKLFSAQVKEAIAPTENILITMRIRDALPHLYEELKASDTRLVYGNIYIDNAKITKITNEPSIKSIPNLDGELIASQDPIRSNIAVEIEATVPKEIATFRLGNQDVKVGRTFFLKTRTFEVISLIESIKVIE